MGGGQAQSNLGVPVKYSSQGRERMDIKQYKDQADEVFFKLIKDFKPPNYVGDSLENRLRGLLGFGTSENPIVKPDEAFSDALLASKDPNVWDIMSMLFLSTLIEDGPLGNIGNILTIKQIIAQDYNSSPAVLVFFIKMYGCSLFMGYGNIDMPWPPADYPINLPSPYSIPGYYSESFTDAICRVFDILFKNVTIQDVYSDFQQKKESRMTNEQIIDYFNSFAKAIDPTQPNPEIILKNLFAQAKVVGTHVYSEEKSASRQAIALTNPVYEDYLRSLQSLHCYTENPNTRFKTPPLQWMLTDVTDWRQQVFLVIPTQEYSPANFQYLNIQDYENPIIAGDVATVQLNYDKFTLISSEADMDKGRHKFSMMIQGYKMCEHMDFLMAVASGVRYMSPRAKKLLPEWMDNTSRFAWLNERLKEWDSRIKTTVSQKKREVWQDMYNIAAAYIQDKQSAAMRYVAAQANLARKQNVNIQRKGADQARQMAINLNRIIDTVSADPNGAFSMLDTNFKPKYALRLAAPNLAKNYAAIKPRSKGFFFGQSKKAYSDKLGTQLRALQARLNATSQQSSQQTSQQSSQQASAADIDSIYADVDELRTDLGEILQSKWDEQVATNIQLPEQTTQRPTDPKEQIQDIHSQLAGIKSVLKEMAERGLLVRGGRRRTRRHRHRKTQKRRRQNQKQYTKTRKHR